MYTTKGTIFVPYAEIQEPFESWYDEPNGRSRIDYFDGMTKTLQFVDMGEYGSKIKLVPANINGHPETKRCFNSSGKMDEPVEAQPSLPDSTDLIYVGKYYQITK